MAEADKSSSGAKQLEPGSPKLIVVLITYTYILQSGVLGLLPTLEVTLDSFNLSSLKLLVKLLNSELGSIFVFTFDLDLMDF